MNEIQKIIEHIKTNKGDSNPYHNNEHLLFVYSQSLLLFNIYKNEYNLTNENKRELSFAALFHDFNHSGGKLTDNENIKIAIKELNKFIEKNKIDINIENVENLIKATEFPHKNIKLNILQKIIRDSDTIGAITENWENIVRNLAKEYGMTIKEFIKIPEKFLNTTKFNTPHCNNILQEKKEHIKKELLNLK